MGDREDLILGAVGYAEGVTGGAGGSVCRVETLEDSGSGSLRACADNSSPRWIVFGVSGTLALSSAVRVRSDTTIDGRGADITIAGRGLQILGEGNVIIHNLKFAAGSDDAIQVRRESRLVWIDHVSLADFGDGLIDITQEATDVTVSWSLFEDHQKVILISANPGDSGDVVIRVTLHHNWFRQTAERHPRARWGRVHAFNNFYDRWTGYGIGSSQRAQVLSEHNIFQAGPNSTAAATRALGSDPEPGDLRSVDDLALGGAVIEERNRESIFEASDAYNYSLDVADDSLRAAIEAGAGWQDVPLP